MKYNTNRLSIPDCLFHGDAISKADAAKIQFNSSNWLKLHRVLAKLTLKELKAYIIVECRGRRRPDIIVRLKARHDRLRELEEAKEINALCLEAAE